MATRDDTATDAPPKKRRRGRPPRINEQMIVQAATSLFARFGYRNTTIVAIADAVGVTDASILHYFPSKFAILEAVLKEENQPAQEDLLDQLRPGGIEALRNLAAWGSRLETHPETTSMHLMLSTESLSEGSEFNGMYEQRYRYIRRQIAAAVQQGIDDGEIRDDVDAGHEATAYVAMLDGLRLQWFLENRKLSIDEHLRAYVEHLIERVKV